MNLLEFGKLNTSVEKNNMKHFTLFIFNLNKKGICENVRN